MTRQDAAQKIAEKLNAEGCEAKVWTGGSKVRVYVKDGDKDAGFVDVGDDRKSTERGCSSVHGIQGLASRVVCQLFGKREAFEDALPAAEPTFHGVPLWTVVKAAKEGNLRTLPLTEDQIAEAVKAGVISESAAMNQDA